MRSAAELLLVEASALRPILEATALEAFDRPTICTGWSVRDVLAHCGAALSRTAAGTTHGFTPEDNEADVAERRPWPLEAVLAELWRGYEEAAVAIDRAGGELDGVGLGEWVHGGDVREALGYEDAYGSAGSDLAVLLLLERSRALGRTSLEVRIDGRAEHFGSDGPAAGTLVTDTATFVRLTGGRAPDPQRYQLASTVASSELILFT